MPSMQVRLSDVVTRIATEFKALRTLINGNAADLSALNTTTKTSLVAAINEVQGAVASASAINDAATGTSTTWSSTKISGEISGAVSAVVASSPAALDTLNELAAALGNDANFATTTATALGNRLRVDTAAQGLTGTQQGNARTNLGLGALAVKATIASGDIDEGAVTLSRIADFAEARILGRAVGAGTGDPQTLTASQVRAIINVADGATANTGTVTSVTGTGTVNGLTLTGTVTGAGALTLGGTLSITASEISNSTTAGRALLTAADAAAQRTALGLGNAATLNTGTAAGTVAAGNHTHGTATTLINGFMSNTDKAKLDNIGEPDTNFVTIFEAGLV